MIQVLSIQGKRVLIDSENYNLVKDYKWEIRWIWKGWRVICRNPYMYLHRIVVGAVYRERITTYNGNYLDCRIANIRRYHISDEDIWYIRWLQDHGWFSKYGMGQSQVQAVSYELGLSPCTITHIARRTHLSKQSYNLPEEIQVEHVSKESI